MREGKLEDTSLLEMENRFNNHDRAARRKYSGFLTSDASLTIYSCFLHREHTCVDSCLLRNVLLLQCCTVITLPYRFPLNLVNINATVAVFPDSQVVLYCKTAVWFCSEATFSS